MAEITVSQLNKYYGENHVLRDLTFEIFKGERVGIVGPNGCGKTTLFKILADMLPYDSGQVFIDPSHRVGLLEQLPVYPAGITVRQVLLEAFSHLYEMEREMRALENNMTGPAMTRYSRLSAEFETRGGYDMDTRYNIMTNGLSIPPDMQDRDFMSLSGGEKTRVNLARIMLSGTDILLLDEPTNHLDLDTIKWLEDYLRGFKGTAVVVSHDRYFLDRATNRTLEIEQGKITSYPGNYSYFVDRKREITEQLEAAKKRQDKEIERLSFTVERMKGWGLGNKKVMRRAFAMEKRLNRIERIQTVRKQKKMHSQFTQADASGEEVFNIIGLTFGYDGPLTAPFDAQILKGERIALLGANGCGKTTLLKTILGDLPPVGGAVYPGAGVKCGYLPQVVSFDSPHLNLVDTMLYGTSCTTQQARDRLGSFLFSGEDVFKRVSALSGGEKTRLKLCLFMGAQVNTLFLDEPTNHLDISSREWLEDAIDDFSETMIFVSHDRYFIERFATRIWQVEKGEIIDFDGSYEAFLEKRQREEALKAAPRTGVQERPLPGEKPKGSPQKLAEKKQKERQRQIAALEIRLSEIETEMSVSTQDYVLLSALLEEKTRLEEELLALYSEEE